MYSVVEIGIYLQNNRHIGFKVPAHFLPGTRLTFAQTLTIERSANLRATAFRTLEVHICGLHRRQRKVGEAKTGSSDCRQS
mgnify:CR=1 FL=1|jgi:hypothetical protein